MRAMIYAAVALVVISAGSNVVLNNAGFSVEEQTSGPAVRLEN